MGWTVMDLVRPRKLRVDISHTNPLFTIPLGQRAELDADERRITFQKRPWIEWNDENVGDR
jgi:muramoyltetrapeptide carboxypeptidase LdcA involved in peptidoglycan recycling